MASKRNGIKQLLKIGQTMCKFIRQWTPTIVAFSGGDVAVGTALAAVLTACEAMEEILIPLINLGD